MVGRRCHIAGQLLQLLSVAHQPQLAILPMCPVHQPQNALVEHMYFPQLGVLLR